MAKHKPATIYSIRPIGKYPQAYVKTLDSKRLEIEYYPVKDQSGIGIYMDRKDARLLSKRIMLCLEDSK